MKKKQWKRRNRRQVEPNTTSESKVIGSLKTPAAGIADHLKYLRNLKRRLSEDPKTPLRKRDKKGYK